MRTILHHLRSCRTRAFFYLPLCLGMGKGRLPESRLGFPGFVPELDRGQPLRSHWFKRCNILNIRRLYGLQWWRQEWHGYCYRNYL